MGREWGADRARTITVGLADGAEPANSRVNPAGGFQAVRSIRVYLFALVGICLLLATTAFGLVMASADATNRQHAEAQTRETAKALSQAVDGKLERAMGVLAALSTSNAALSHDWRTLDQQARAAFRDRDAWIVVQDRKGNQLINTALPAGAALPAGPPATRMWREVASGKPRVCDLVAGLLQPRIVCVDAPIGDGPSPEYAISVIFRPAAFGPIITRDNVRAGNIATLVDRSGKVIWRNIKPAEFVGRTATGPMLRALRSGSDSDVMESRSLEGVPMLSAFDRSALSGWSVIVGQPLDQIETASRQAIWWGSLLALSILLFGAALAALVGAKLVSGVNRLVGATDPERSSEETRPTGIAEIDTVDKALRSAFAARAESERHQQILIGELNHRVKNTLSIVQSLAHQTFRDAASPKEAISAFESRLQALAAAHNLLTKQRWESASMGQIVRTALAPFCAPERCRTQGPDLKVAPQTAVTLALAIHELATNASKYGALSVESGTIDVTWTDEDGRFDMVWQESGGPTVRPPTSDGFGMRLIKRSLAAELRGSVDIDFDETGLRCRFVGQLGTA